jgi:hypothetical protein
MFQIGDTVLIFRSRYDIEPRQETVVRIGTKQLILSDGSRFTIDGREWGNSGSSSCLTIKPATEERLAHLQWQREQELEERRLNLRNAVVRWIDRLPFAALEALYSFLRERGMPEVT